MCIYTQLWTVSFNLPLHVGYTLNSLYIWLLYLHFVISDGWFLLLVIQGVERCYHCSDDCCASNDLFLHFTLMLLADVTWWLAHIHLFYRLLLIFVLCIYLVLFDDVIASFIHYHVYDKISLMTFMDPKTKAIDLISQVWIW